MSDFELSLKIITLGESGAGKTKLIMRYKDKTYQDINVSTVGIEFQYKIITYNNRPIKLVIYDTSGQEKFRTIVSNYYKNTDGVILVYDISSKKSFSKIQYWVDEIRNNSNNDNNTYVLFGNKSDLENERQVTYEEGKEYADKNKLEFMEGSAKSGQNIKELFILLVQKIMKNRELNEELSTSKNVSHLLTYHKSFGNKKRRSVEDKEKCC